MTANDLPLSQRVHAPAEVPLPEHPQVAVWRAMTPDDLDAVMVAVRAADAIDHPSWVTPREDVADFFDLEGFDAERDSIIGVDETGRVVATTVVSRSAAAATAVQVSLFGFVLPELRGLGIGRELLPWGTARAEQVLAASDSTLPGRIFSYQYERNATAIALAERGGYQTQRYFASMERVLADPVPDVPVCDDVRIVQVTPAMLEPARIARNDAFRDHWGSQPSTPERWGKFVDGPFLRHDLSFVAVAPAEAGSEGSFELDGSTVRIVAFALGAVNQEDWEPQGFSSVYIALIGVVRDRRGQRLAPAVIGAQLRAAAAAGLERATLDVDTDSPTGANTLYTRLGFTQTELEVALVREY